MKPARDDAATVALRDFAERLADALDTACFIFEVRNDNDSTRERWRDTLRIAWLAGLIHEDVYMPPPDFDLEQELAEAYRPLIDEDRVREWREALRDGL